MQEIQGASLPRYVDPHATLSGKRLSGEALMFFVSSRINNLDDELSNMMGTQEKSLKTKQWLTEYKDKLQTWQNTESGPQRERYKADFKGFLSTCPDPVLERELTSVLGNSLDRNVPPANRPFHGKEAWKSLVSKLDAQIDELNTGSEMQMIRMQQVMSQRQLAVQLSTNMLNKLSQGLDTIAGNFR